MIREPYIFLSQNYAKYALDEQINEVSFKNLELSGLPRVLTFYLTDKYGNYINRSVDTLLLEDTNIVSATLEYEKDGQYFPWFTLSGNTDTTVLLKNAEPVSACSIRLTVPAEQNPSVVTIGKLGLYRYLCDLCAETDSSFKVDANSGSYRTLSGDIVYYGDYGKWQSKIKISNLPKEQFDTLTKEIRETNELTIIPYKDFDFTAVYECYLEPKVEYDVNRKTELYALELEAQEL